MTHPQLLGHRIKFRSPLLLILGLYLNSVPVSPPLSKAQLLLWTGSPWPSPEDVTPSPTICILSSVPLCKLTYLQGVIVIYHIQTLKVYCRKSHIANECPQNISLTSNLFHLSSHYLSQIWKSSFSLCPQTLYSPDLSPRYFCLFSKLKMTTTTKGKHFESTRNI